MLRGMLRGLQRGIPCRVGYLPGCDAIRDWIGRMQVKGKYTLIEINYDEDDSAATPAAPSKAPAAAGVRAIASSRRNHACVRAAGA